MIALRQRVRLIKVVGAASPELRAHLGLVGRVVAVRERAGATVYGVAFADGERYWFGGQEIEDAEGERAGVSVE